MRKVRCNGRMIPSDVAPELAEKLWIKKGSVFYHPKKGMVKVLDGGWITKNGRQATIISLNTHQEDILD